jgi:YVTN family beta-propeller protein
MMKSLVVFGVVCLLGLSLILLGCGRGSTPAPVAIAYVAHSQSHSLTVVNIPANKTVSRIEIGNSSFSSLTQVASYPQRVAVTPDGSRAYVTDGNTSIWAVDTSSNSVIAKLPAGSEPTSLVVSPDGTSVYATTATCAVLQCGGPSQPLAMTSVVVMDVATNSWKATITLGKATDIWASAIAISPDGTRAYVPDAQGHVWVINTATNKIAATITLAHALLADATVSHDGNSLYVVGISPGSTNSSFLTVIDTQAA